MAYVLLQSAATLQLLNQSLTLSTLTLPTGVVLNSSRPPRFAVFGKYVVMVNTPTLPITIDPSGIVRLLCPQPPVLAISLGATGGAGNLSGDYRARQTYVIRDSDGAIIAESDYSPEMTLPYTAAAKTLDAEGLNLSQQAVTGSRIHRTTSGGSVYFHWIDVDGNTQTTSDSDDTTDAALTTVASQVLGTPPDLTLVVSWRDRLWGVDRIDIDHLRYTESETMYAWPSTNDIIVPRPGSDIRGVTGLVSRRDALGIGRRNSLHQMTGDSSTNFRLVKLSEAVGIESNESIVVYRDVAYFLWKDGVYTWDANGIVCISDGSGGRGMVRSWFATDSYFNRSRFQYAFAQIDPVRDKYRLFLASAGSSVEDRWVEFDITERTWWGPHKTGFFSPTATVTVPNSSDTLIAMMASSSGYLWQEQATRTDSSLTPTAIDYDVDTKRHDGRTPDIEKNWQQLSLLSKAQAAGSLSVTPYVGSVTASAGTAITANMTKGREKLPRLGAGKCCGFNFRHNVVAQDVEIYGYELPFYELGRR